MSLTKSTLHTADGIDGKFNGIDAKLLWMKLYNFEKNVPTMPPHEQVLMRFRIAEIRQQLEALGTTLAILPHMGNKPETIQELRSKLEKHRRNVKILPPEMSLSVNIEIHRIEKRLAELEGTTRPTPPPAA